MDSFKVTFYFQGGVYASFHQSFVSIDEANISIHKIFQSKELIRINGGCLDTSKANGYSVSPSGAISTDLRLEWGFMLNK